MCDMINFYELPQVQALAPKYHNPNYDIHHLKIPFRMGIIGSSGSGKTNIVLNLVRLMNNTFNKIYLFTKNHDEPLYNFLQLQIGNSDLFEMYNGLDELDKWDLNTKFDGQQVLVIFDDLMLERDQTSIEQLFIRGRKLGKGVSCCYLAQSYYTIPIDIRRQFTYLILRKLPSTRDIAAILKENSLSIDKDTLLKLYHFCTDNDMTNFLLIDTNASPDEMFRKGFNKIIRLS